MTHRDTTYKARFEALRSLAFGSIGAGFATIGDPIADEAEITLLINNTDADVIASADGVQGHFFCPMWSGRVIDWKTNDKVVGNLTQFYISHNGAAPTVGAVYLEVTV